jgi:YfiH family protein
MVESWTESLSVEGGVPNRVFIRCTERSDGNLSVVSDAGRLETVRRRIVDRRWIWLRQVHGNRVIVVGDDLAPDDLDRLAGAEADAIVTRRSDIAIAAHSADCATIALWSDDGVIGVVHAGWRGLELDAIGEAATAMRNLGAGPIHARTGPCIGVECYEFAEAELSRMIAALGPEVAGLTGDGKEALDVRRAVARSLDRSGVEFLGGSTRCSACSGAELWSHRARGEHERQALVVWMGQGE